MRKPETNISIKVLIILFPLFALLCPVSHPTKSYVEMILRNLQGQGDFLKQKCTSCKKQLFFFFYSLTVSSLIFLVADFSLVEPQVSLEPGQTSGPTQMEMGTHMPKRTTAS